MAKNPSRKPRAPSKAAVKAAADRAEARSANTKPQSAAAPAAKPTEAVKRAITENQLRALIKITKSHKDQISQLTGSLREKIAYAKENHYLSTGALAIVRKFDAMEPEKAAALWDDVLDYMSKSGVMERIESVPKLPLGDKGKTDDETEGKAEAGPASDGKVSRPRFGQGHPNFGDGHGKVVRDAAAGVASRNTVAAIATDAGAKTAPPSVP